MDGISEHQIKKEAATEIPAKKYLYILIFSYFSIYLYISRTQSITHDFKNQWHRVEMFYSTEHRKYHEVMRLYYFEGDDLKELKENSIKYSNEGM